MTDSHHINLDDVTQKFQDLNMSWIPNSRQPALSPKEKYINEKIYPINKKDLLNLERKLTPNYTERQLNFKTEQEQAPSKLMQKKLAELSDKRHKKEVIKKKANSRVQPIPSTLITRESKLAVYKNELERDYNEREKLAQAENVILESYTQKYFKPVVATKGFLETEEMRQVRGEMENKAARLQFMKENRESALLYALRTEIRKDLSHEPKEIEKLNKEEKVQNLLDNPVYKYRVGSHVQNTTAFKMKPQDKKTAAEKLSLSLEAKLQAGLQSKELFSVDALKKTPLERTMMFSQFKNALASAENKVKDEQSIKLGKKTGFKPF